MTALYVERDSSHLLVRRRMLGTMTRAEWDAPALRQAALDRCWTMAERAIRSEDEELVSAALVALYCHPINGAVVCANINPGAGRAQWVDPLGNPLARLPIEPTGLGWVRRNTTYRAWAEGPLPHIEPDMLPARSPLDDPDIQAMRGQNGRLRDLIDASLGPANFAPMPREMPTTEHLVDFRIRGVCKRRDFRVLRSLQDEGLGSKILTSEGIVE